MSLNILDNTNYDLLQIINSIYDDIKEHLSQEQIVSYIYNQLHNSNNYSSQYISNHILIFYQFEYPELLELAQNQINIITSTNDISINDISTNEVVNFTLFGNIIQFDLSENNLINTLAQDLNIVVNTPPLVRPSRSRTRLTRSFREPHINLRRRRNMHVQFNNIENNDNNGTEIDDLEQRILNNTFTYSMSNISSLINNINASEPSNNYIFDPNFILNGLEDVKVTLKQDELKQDCVEYNLLNDDIKLANKICTICQDDYKNNDLIRQIKCNHIFHINCIDTWLLDYNYKCPICRQECGEHEIKY